MCYIKYKIQYIKVSKIIQKVEKYKSNIIIVLLVFLIICIGYLYYVSKENEFSQEQSIENLIMLFKDEVNFMYNETERLLENTPSENRLKVGLLKIEIGMSKINGFLKLGNSIIDESIEYNLTFASISELATIELKNNEDILSYIQKINNLLDYIIEELERLEFNDSLDVSEFNNIIIEATEKFMK